MDIQLMTKFFMGCTIVNISLLILSFFLRMFAADCGSDGRVMGSSIRIMSRPEETADERE